MESRVQRFLCIKEKSKMSINTKLLAKICKTPGAPGFEQKVRELVIKEVNVLVDEVELDNMGNVYAIKRGTPKKGQEMKRVMIGAHMDEIGFIVTHIDSNGFIRFHTLGGFDPKTFPPRHRILRSVWDATGAGKRRWTESGRRRFHWVAS